MKNHKENEEELDIDENEKDETEKNSEETIKEDENNDDLKKIRSIKVYIEQWKNRRWMAWVSLLSIIMVTSLLLFYTSIDRIKATENIIEWFLITMSTIVAAYMGLSTWASLTKKN